MRGYRRTRIVSEYSDRAPSKTGGVFRFVFRAAVALALSFGFVAYSASSVGDMAVSKVSFSISKGDTKASLPKKLKLDVSEWRFRLYLKYFAPEVELQVGTFDAKAGTSVNDVFSKVLPNPSTKDLTITFLPGWTVFDIDAYLAESGILPEGSVSRIDSATLSALAEKYPFLRGVSSLEGFLYPDTYRIRPGSDAKTVLSKALSNFDAKIYSKHSDLGGKFYETLIFASIVEKEERSVKNKPVVAGVLKSRLDGRCADTGKIIGADATVCYAYSITSKQCTPSFIAEHVYEETDYNTRKKSGLPPTPIANPTVESFRAARDPDVSEGYCYYLHDNDGIIHYGRDAGEHSRNKSLYLGR